MRTIAKHVGYTLPLLTTVAWNPADSETLFVGACPGITGDTYAKARIQVPKTGVIKRLWLNVTVSGTLGSNESVVHSLRINDTTDVTGVAGTYEAIQQNLVNAAVNTAVNTGDYIALKVVAPVWVTNPTSVRFFGHVYIE